MYWSRIASLILKGYVFIWSGTNLGGDNADLNVAKNTLQEVRNLEGVTLGLAANYTTASTAKVFNNDYPICRYADVLLLPLSLTILNNDPLLRQTPGY